jgi:hypothetical protein
MSDAALSAPPALRVLLRGVVDYAGLFPPASLDMAAAAGEYAMHRASPDEWMLGRFVLPAARLTEFEQAAKPVMPTEAWQSWALSALMSGDVEEDVARAEQFNERHMDKRAGAVLVDTVELKVNSPRDVAHAGELLDRRFDTYMEVPVGEDPAALIEAIAKTHAKAKIRTGGTTADAFPSSAQVVRFIARCLGHNVGFKATAGLHHPLRNEYRLTYAPDAPRATMFGFLNVLLATAALAGGAGEKAATAILESRDLGKIEFTPDLVRVAEVELTLADIRRARDTMASFGSCSFREPVDDLRVLHLL